MRFRFTAALLCFAALPMTTSAIADAPSGNSDSRVLISDDYRGDESGATMRKPMRGDWKIGDGVAVVTQDDALYKKYKNHGPIMIYHVDHDDALAVTEFKPSGCKTVVFTMDGENGHVFRVKLAKKGKSQILTYEDKKPGDAKAKPVFLDAKLPLLKDDQWTRLMVKVKGSRATVTIGEQTFEVQHPIIDREKKIAKIGFAFGQLSIRTFNLKEL